MSDKKESSLFSGSGPVKLSSISQSERLKSLNTSEQQTYENILEKTQEQKTEEISKTSIDSSMIDMSADTIPQKYESDKYPSNYPLESNIETSWAKYKVKPKVSSGAFVHPRGLVIGNVIINSGVFIAPFASVRGDEDEPIFIGDDSSILEGSIVNSLPTERNGKKLSHRLIKVGAKDYPIYIASKVTVSQGVKIHGPAFIGSNSFIGMGALIFWAKIGMHCVIEPGALVINVEIPDGCFVPAGLSVTNQKIVKTLPVITSRYRFQTINQEMLEENGEIVRSHLHDG